MVEGSMRSLTQLLDEGSIRLAASSERTAEPATARAMQVQQAIDHEHAMQAAPMNRAVHQGQPAVPHAIVAAGNAAGTDVRGAVLSEVLARTPEGSPAESRTTMITARGLTALASQRGGTLAIRLDPPSLGEVSIRMSVIDGVVRAELTAASSAARALMEKGIDALRASIESRGLTVERLSINGPIATSESHSARSESNQGQLHQQGGAREQGMNEDRSDAAGHESRGRGDEQRSRSTEEHEDSHSTRESFKQVLAEDTT
jgi:flagellar hook-length control protein FliK